MDVSKHKPIATKVGIDDNKSRTNEKIRSEFAAILPTLDKTHPLFLYDFHYGDLIIDTFDDRKYMVICYTYNVNYEEIIPERKWGILVVRMHDEFDLSKQIFVTLQQLYSILPETGRFRFEMCGGFVSMIANKYEYPNPEPVGISNKSLALNIKDMI